MFGNISGNKSNIYERDWSQFDQENFILDYFSVDWEDLLKTDELNVDNSTRMYLDKINVVRYFLTAIWLPYDQLWAFIEGTASLT